MNYKELSVLYECECPHLKRGLGFREIFEQKVTKHILDTFSPQKFTHLVYVSQGPGGFLADMNIISNLIEHPYQQLDLVFIEPLYQKNADILYACLEVKTWCHQNSTTYRSITPHLYTSLTAYTKACVAQEHLKGHVFITIDPDDAATVPDFSSVAFRKKLCHFAQRALRPESPFYYLYFQQHQQQPCRHMIMGHHSMYENQSLLTCDHWYGEVSFKEHYTQQVFLNNTAVYPFDLAQHRVQIEHDILTDQFLASLF